MRCNGAILWSSKQFKMAVPDSTAEAETAEGSRATKSTIYIKNVLMGIGRAAVGAVTLCCDNSAMYDLVKKHGSSQRTRHFERAITLVKWAVLRLLITPWLVTTDCMIADIFTKAVDKETFMEMRGWLHNDIENKGNKVVDRMLTLMKRIGGYPSQ